MCINVFHNVELSLGLDRQAHYTTLAKNRTFFGGLDPYGRQLAGLILTPLPGWNSKDHGPPSARGPKAALITGNGPRKVLFRIKGNFTFYFSIVTCSC
jgi:hypothetical protein